MSFAAITLCVASQRVFIVTVVVYFVIDSVRKLLATHSYINLALLTIQINFFVQIRVHWVGGGALVNKLTNIRVHIRW
jgi:hypothetical protein